MANLGNQIINFKFREELVGAVLNYLLTYIFENAGVIKLNYQVYSSTEIVIQKGSSFLLAPINKPDIYVKIDLIEDKIITINDGEYLVAYMNWEEDENNHVIFDTVTTPTNGQIILGKAQYTSGILSGLDLSEQTKAKVSSKLASTGGEGGGCSVIENSDASSVRGYVQGNSVNNIALRNDVLNNNLNAEYLGNDVSKYKAGNEENMIAVKNGVVNANLIAEMLGNENGSNFAVNNGEIQTNLNAKYLDDIEYDKFATTSHTHTLDQINDNGVYKRVPAEYVDNDHLIITDGIVDQAANYTKIHPFAWIKGNLVVPYFQFFKAIGSLTSASDGTVVDWPYTIEYKVEYTANPIIITTRFHNGSVYDDTGYSNIQSYNINVPPETKKVGVRALQTGKCSSNYVVVQSCGAWFFTTFVVGYL